MADWLNPWSLAGATFVTGLFTQIVFSRQRWRAVVIIAVAPLILLTATIWWRIWEQDALWVIAYVMALLICCGASLSSLLAVDGARRSLRKYHNVYIRYPRGKGTQRRHCGAFQLKAARALLETPPWPRNGIIVGANGHLALDAHRSKKGLESNIDSTYVPIDPFFAPLFPSVDPTHDTSREQDRAFV